MLLNSSRWLTLLVATLVLGSAWIWYSRDPRGANAATGVAAQVGFRAPDFNLERSDGGQVALSELRGRPVLINFWATWCIPCRAEMPAIQAVATRYAQDGLVVLLINQQEDTETIGAFLESMAVTATVLLDPDASTATAYRVRALPTTFFIGRDGAVEEMAIGGPMTEAYLQSQVESLLEAP